MAINFPNSPSNGATVTISGITYTYNSSKNAWAPNTPTILGFDSDQVKTIIAENTITAGFDSDQVVTIVNENSKTTIGIKNVNNF